MATTWTSTPRSLADGFSLRYLEEQGYIVVADTLDEMAADAGHGC